MEIYGNATTFNLETVLKQNITACDYYRNDCTRLPDWQSVVDEIYNAVSDVEPWIGGNARGPSSAFCLLHRLFTLRLSVEEVTATINHADSPFIRAVGWPGRWLRRPCRGAGLGWDAACQPLPRPGRRGAARHLHASTRGGLSPPAAAQRRGPSCAARRRGRASRDRGRGAVHSQSLLPRPSRPPEIPPFRLASSTCGMSVTPATCGTGSRAMWRTRRCGGRGGGRGGRGEGRAGLWQGRRGEGRAVARARPLALQRPAAARATLVKRRRPTPAHASPAQEFKPTKFAGAVTMGDFCRDLLLEQVGPGFGVSAPGEGGHCGAKPSPATLRRWRLERTVAVGRPPFPLDARANGPPRPAPAPALHRSFTLRRYSPGYPRRCRTRSPRR
jgi:hypothetical protein